MTPQNSLCLWNKIIRKASSAHDKSFFFFWKVDFLIFKKLRKSTFQKRLKKRPNANLYVEYSRTYDFLRILSSLIRQLNGLKTFVAPFLPTRLTASGSPRMKTTTFYAKWPVGSFGQKHEFQGISISRKICYVKLGFQILFAVECSV